MSYTNLEEGRNKMSHTTFDNEKLLRVEAEIHAILVKNNIYMGADSGDCGSCIILVDNDKDEVLYSEIL
jgi:aerobic-type carbon monoxide dehydrogenase small subunit (CoxS/CutS family)